MHRIDVLPAVETAGILQGKFRFVAVDGAAVHQQAGGLVHCQQPVVSVDFNKRVGSRRTHGNGGVRHHQCATALENTFSTTTPATIKPMPSTAGRSSFCPYSSQATAVISTMPTPDQMARSE